jgi:hypothetical protein
LLFVSHPRLTTAFRPRVSLFVFTMAKPHPCTASDKVRHSAICPLRLDAGSRHARVVHIVIGGLIHSIRMQSFVSSENSPLPPTITACRSLFVLKHYRRVYSCGRPCVVWGTSAWRTRVSQTDVNPVGLPFRSRGSRTPRHSLSLGCHEFPRFV